MLIQKEIRLCSYHTRHTARFQGGGCTVSPSGSARRVFVPPKRLHNPFYFEGDNLFLPEIKQITPLFSSSERNHDVACRRSQTAMHLWYCMVHYRRTPNTDLWGLGCWMSVGARANMQITGIEPVWPLFFRSAQWIKSCEFMWPPCKRKQKASVPLKLWRPLQTGDF